MYDPLGWGKGTGVVSWVCLFDEVSRTRGDFVLFTFLPFPPLLFDYCVVCCSKSVLFSSPLY
jgi:hypothetical protein